MKVVNLILKCKRFIVNMQLIDVKVIEGLKNIFAPNDIGVEKPSVECKGPSAKSLGENKIIDI